MMTNDDKDAINRNFFTYAEPKELLFIEVQTFTGIQFHVSQHCAQI